MKIVDHPVPSYGLFLLSALLLAQPLRVVYADIVYKCVKGGNITYTAKPSGNDGLCQETVIEEQNPEDYARAMEEKRRRLEEDRLAEERRLKEREVRAKELEAAAAARAARAAEQQSRMQNQQQPENPTVPGYPYYYPYLRGRGPVNPAPLPSPGQANPFPGRPPGYVPHKRIDPPVQHTQPTPSQNLPYR